METFPASVAINRMPTGHGRFQRLATWLLPPCGDRYPQQEGTLLTKRYSSARDGATFILMLHFIARDWMKPFLAINGPSRTVKRFSGDLSPIGFADAKPWVS